MINLENFLRRKIKPENRVRIELTEDELSICQVGVAEYAARCRQDIDMLYTRGIEDRKLEVEVEKAVKVLELLFSRGGGGYL